MIKEQITQDILAARKAKETLKLEALQAVKAATELLSKTPTEADYITSLRKVIAQYQETAHFASQAKKEENFNKAYTAYTLLEEYLPKPLDEPQVIALIKATAATNNLTFEKKNMGTITKLTVTASEGATDGKTVSTLVNQLISTNQ